MNWRWELTGILKSIYLRRLLARPFFTRASTRAEDSLSVSILLVWLREPKLHLHLHAVIHANRKAEVPTPLLHEYFLCLLHQSRLPLQLPSSFERSAMARLNSGPQPSESPMDFAYDNGHGPVSADSPFLQSDVNNFPFKDGFAGHKSMPEIPEINFHIR